MRKHKLSAFIQVQNVEDINKKVNIGGFLMKDTEYNRFSLSLKYILSVSYGLPNVCTTMPALIQYDYLYNIYIFGDLTSICNTENINNIIVNKYLLKTMSSSALTTVRDLENRE